jgi:hypothetical protein
LIERDSRGAVDSFGMTMLRAFMIERNEAVSERLVDMSGLDEELA